MLPYSNTPILQPISTGFAGLGMMVITPQLLCEVYLILITSIALIADSEAWSKWAVMASAEAVGS